MTVGAEQGEIAEVGSPVQVPADPALDARHPLRWTSIVLGSAALLLLLLNAASAVEWFDERAPTPATERLRAPVARWSAVADSLALGGIRTHLRGAWQGVRAARFGSEQPGEPGSDQR